MPSKIYLSALFLQLSHPVSGAGCKAAGCEGTEAFLLGFGSLSAENL